VRSRVGCGGSACAALLGGSSGIREDSATTRRSGGCGLRMIWCHVAQTAQEKELSRRDAKAQRGREEERKRGREGEDALSPFASLRLCASFFLSSCSLSLSAVFTSMTLERNAVRGIRDFDFDFDPDFDFDYEG
jgi:hypothetical protein